ncbi:MAG: hypothetical protein KC586_27125, partial [Myxococcales bacterium]|nr:hypothetical protein [Myxococcales bacterium]
LRQIAFHVRTQGPELLVQLCPRTTKASSNQALATTGKRRPRIVARVRPPAQATSFTNDLGRLPGAMVAKRPTLDGSNA